MLLAMQYDVQNLDGQHWNGERGTKCSSVTNLQFANHRSKAIFGTKCHNILQLVVTTCGHVQFVKILIRIRNSPYWQPWSFLMGRTELFSHNDIYINKTLHPHWHTGQVLVVTIFWWAKIWTHYSLSSRKRPPPISSHLGLTVWVVTYVRFDCISAEYTRFHD